MWKKLFSLALVVLLCHAGDALLVRNVGAWQRTTVEDKVKRLLPNAALVPKRK